MLKETPLKLHIGDLLSCEIVTAEGKKIGHVADLEISEGLVYEVTAIFFGQQGWLHRWHVLFPFAQMFGLRAKPCKVPWGAIACFEHAKVRLQPGWPPKSGTQRKII